MSPLLANIYLHYALKVCRYLVIDFGTSLSPKSTRLRDSHWAPAALRPCRYATPSKTRCWLRSTPAMAGRRFGCAFARPAPLRDFAPARIRPRKRAYAYRGLRALASLSMARSA